MIRRLIAAGVLSLFAATATGCEASPSSSGAKGVVVKREVREPRNGPDYYEITVREEGGKKDKGRVTKRTYERCQVGDPWPSCKKEKSR